MSFLGNNITGLISNSHAVGNMSPLELYHQQELVEQASETLKTVKHKDMQPPTRISVYAAGQNKTLLLAAALILAYMFIR